MHEPYSGTGSQALKLSRSENDDHSVQLNLGGELDATTVDGLAEWMATLRLDGERHVVLNLSELTFCDARGLAALLAMRETLLQQGRHLTLRSVPPMTRQIIHVSGLDPLLEIS